MKEDAGGQPVTFAKQVLCRSHPANDRGERSYQNCYVKKHVLPFYVEQIQFHILVYWHGAGRTDLPQAGYSGSSLQSLTLARSVLSDDKRHFRSRTYQAHLTRDHVDQLRQFIKTQSSQN